MLAEEAVKIIEEAFIIRNDTYAIQTETSYQRVPKTIMESDILEHLEGKKTIGVYQFNKNRTKWVCFDFDGTVLEEQFDLAKKFSQKLTEQNIQNILEFSGKKGYHIWVLCEEADGTSAKYWAEEISEVSGAHEIFPKQESAGDGYGNLVKLPLGLHQISKKESHFFDENFLPLNKYQSIEFLGKKILTKNKVPKIIVKEIIRTITKPITKTPMPSYIQHIINSGANEGDRHKNVFIITKELYHCGFTKEEILQCALTFNNNCPKPKLEYVITTHVNYLLQYPEKYLQKETVEDISLEQVKELTKITYEKVIETYKKWFYLTNTEQIDLGLAVAISRKEKGQPLWIIEVAPSGGGKTELLKPFADFRQPGTTEIISKITANTFLSGISKRKMPHTDFAETLENNPKLFLTYDFAQFAKLESKEKAQIWAQLRDLYDGFLERKAFDCNKKVENIKVNWLICSTPIIDSELLVQQELGTRELIFRLRHEEINKKELMQAIWKNAGCEETKRKELNQITRAFIEKKESEGLKEIELNQSQREELEKIALLVSVLRAATESDPYTGELTNIVYEEMPTRILLQLHTLYCGLRNLSEEFGHERAIRILHRIAISSIHPVRLRILLEIIKESNISTTNIQKKLCVGWKTIITQLYTAKQLGLIDFSEEEEIEGQIRGWKKKNWFATKNEVILYLKRIYSIAEKEVSAVY